MTGYTPYPDKEEHDFTRKMTLLLVRANKVIEENISIVADIKAAMNQHINATKEK